MNNNSVNPFFEKPWNSDSFYNTYEEADERRNSLKDEEDLQVKVKRLSQRFVVKTRSIKIVEEKSKKKGNNANQRSKNTAKPKVDQRRDRKGRKSF
jgi:hypothetical protein